MGLVFTGAAALAIVQTVMFPVTMVTNTFAPTDTMPVWLGTLAEWNPLSATVTATRAAVRQPGCRRRLVRGAARDRSWPSCGRS